VDACDPSGGMLAEAGKLLAAAPAPVTLARAGMLEFLESRPAGSADLAVALWSADGHTLWTNSRAMEIAGIGSDTPDPENGRIDRDPATGEPVGSFQESASDAIEVFFPETTDENLDQALRYSMRHMNSLGITAWQDARVYISNDPFRALQTYERAAAAGALTVHIVESLNWNNDRGLDQIPDILAAREKYDRPEARANTVKIFMDGVIEPQTAALLVDYTDRPGYRGEVQVKPDVLNAAVNPGCFITRSRYESVGACKRNGSSYVSDASVVSPGVTKSQPTMTPTPVSSPVATQFSSSNCNVASDSAMVLSTR